jgi:glycerophosphoryl diester phosphodiesterase
MLNALGISLLAMSFLGQIQVYSHRGARSFAPENTRPGVEAALRIGADWVDVDVVLTADGEVLVSHDPVLNPAIVRGADGTYVAANSVVVKTLSLRELRRFDVGRIDPRSAYAKFFPDQIAIDGTRMPTLREVVRLVHERVRNRIGFQIEMKTDPTNPAISADPVRFARALYRILREERIVDRVEVQAFDFTCLYALQNLDRHLRTAYLTSRDNEPGGVDDFFSSDPKVAGRWTGGKLVKDYQNSIPRMVKALGGTNWEPEDAELTMENLELAHQLGLKVVVWSWPEQLGTAFDPAMVAKMIDWGVDGIITDDPGRLTSMLAARGLPVPPRFHVD